MSRRSLFSLTFVLVSLAAAPAFAQVSLFDGFGGARDYGSQCLGPNDDGSSRSIDITSIFPSGIQFFDRSHTSMFVNTNGNVTFSGGLARYTPNAFPVADQPMIAPFWADVDIRFDPTDCEDNDGGSGYAGDCHNPSSNGVWWHLDTVGRRIVVTWDQVGYFDCNTSKRMNFQLILTPVPASSCAMEGDFDVEFRFNTCEWNTGDASGGESGLAPGVMDGFRRVACTNLLGREFCPADPTASCSGGFCMARATPAQSGFDAGNSTDFVEIPGSRTNEIHSILCTDSNVGEPGIWRFQIRRGSVLCPDAGESCDTGAQGVCGLGRTACVGGATECRQDLMPSDESCDALDNDCDGTVDEGGGLCGASQVCSRGNCIGSCFEGGCPAGLACTADGICIDEACIDVTCPASERCRLGVCVGACTGVVCPGDLTCVSGQCVDTCAGTTCDECTVCRGGGCAPRCSPGTCPAGQECADSGLCVDTGCAALTCPAGEICRAGACVDSCTGAICPAGEACRMGDCVPTGMGVPPGTDGGSAGLDGSISPGADGSVPGMDAGPYGNPTPGCGCRAIGDAAPAPFGLLALFGLIAFGVRRRFGR
ncbi:MAG TPA: hypothetical protein ENK57_17385 [Polyangiaceae bacterium]|nr:hypothetical protein [Polyangiaceae bacterium]